MTTVNLEAHVAQLEAEDRERRFQRAYWFGNVDELDELAPCDCCCGEHTHTWCTARRWNGCQTQVGCMSAYYTDVDTFVCAWARNLVTAGEVPSGKVDCRPIQEVTPSDVEGFQQVHWFCGVLGWPLALKLAGWPDDLGTVFTGSPPCQPFSTAGRRKGFDDERHLWPTFYNLIRECRPDAIFIEQVASPDGRAWLDTVWADLERAKYAVGATNLCAGGIGAPHLRQRLYIVAVAGGERRERLRLHLRERRPRSTVLEARRRGEARELADATSTRRRRSWSTGEAQPPPEVASESRRSSGADAGIVGDASGARSGRNAAEVLGTEDRSEREGIFARRLSHESVPTGAVRGFWRGAEWVACYDPRTDGVCYRPAQPGHEPLATRSPGRVGRLRAYGNALCAPLAAAFIEAVMEVICDAAEE